MSSLKDVISRKFGGSDSNPFIRSDPSTDPVSIDDFLSDIKSRSGIKLDTEYVDSRGTILDTSSLRTIQSALDEWVQELGFGAYTDLFVNISGTSTSSKIKTQTLKKINSSISGNSDLSDYLTTTFGSSTISNTDEVLSFLQHGYSIDIPGTIAGGGAPAPAPGAPAPGPSGSGNDIIDRINAMKGKFATFRRDLSTVVAGKKTELQTEVDSLNDTKTEIDAYLSGTFSSYAPSATDIATINTFCDGIEGKLTGIIDGVKGYYDEQIAAYKVYNAALGDVKTELDGLENDLEAIGIYTRAPTP